MAKKATTKKPGQGKKVPAKAPTKKSMVKHLVAPDINELFEKGEIEAETALLMQVTFRANQIANKPC